MSWVDDKLTEQFYRWELRGRGWQVCEYPVSLEPAFRPFIGHFVPPRADRDEGRRHTFLSSLVQRMGRALSGQDGEDTGVLTGAEEEEPPPEFWAREAVAESQIILPREHKFPRESFESLLLSLSSCDEPLAFEVFGTREETVMQFAGHPCDAALLRRQVQGRFAGVAIHPCEDAVVHALAQAAPSSAVAEFGLEGEFMLKLNANGKWQPGLFAALSDLAEGELGVAQILFQPARHTWAESGLLAVTDGEGGPFFVNRPALAKAAVEKFSSPLFAVVLRMAARADDADRAWRIIAEMAGGLGALAKPGGNNLVPLANSHDDAAAHEEDLIRRQSHRSGMLLSLDELVSLVQFPDASLHAPKLRRDTGRTRPAPRPAEQNGNIMLGENVHAGVAQPVRLAAEQRVRHLHCIGASGTGKSTFLANLIRQDIESGEGIAVLDPHGDLIEHVLGIIPESRIPDVILLDPSDEEYSVGFNILSAHSDFEKTLLASDLVSVFQRLSTSWGDQMASVLNNAILAFLESSEGGTLADLRRFLLDAGWRKQFLRTVQDPDIVYYWEKGFPQLGGNKSIGPVLTRLESFLAPKPIRYMVSQRENKLDFANITDAGKIFLAKLSQGQIGRENAWLLGSLLVSKLQQTAMARQRMRAEQRRPFWLYIDEFHHFITPSMSEILSGARKYRMGLTLAHQELAQLKREPEVASAVMSNAGTRIAFRVSEGDARALEDGFEHFTARELQSLETGEAICRIERADADFNLRVLPPEAEDEAQTHARRVEIVEASRRAYAAPRAEIEAMFRHRTEVQPSADQAPPAKRGADHVDGVRQEPEQAPPVNEAPVEVVPTESVPAPSVPAESVPPSTPPTRTSPRPGPSPSKPPPVARDLGIGGQQHQAIQQRIKAVAESLGFRTQIEKEVLQGQGRVDIFLERHGRQIACEVSVENTIDFEIGNIRKCLAAGIESIAFVSPDEKRLGKMTSAVSNSLGAEAASRVAYFLPDQFIEHLQTLALQPAPPPPPEEKIVRGYKVKRTVVQLSPEELKSHEQEAMRIVADAARKGRRKSK